MTFNYKDEVFSIERYPKTENRSLKPWNAGDEYALTYLNDKISEGDSIALINDKFGFLSTALHRYSPITVVDLKSQEKSIVNNFEYNKIDIGDLNMISPLSAIEEKLDFAIVRIPKSTDLFRLYLSQIHSSIKDGGEVVCSFMTKNFNKSIIKVAEEFFDTAEQSLAWKKSRLIVLKGKKDIEKQDLLNEVKFTSEKSFKQYLGVFSAKNIDYASQYLVNHISVNQGDKKLLDLASGNGVLAWDLRQKCSDCEIHLVDDSLLAVESSKLNLESDNTFFHVGDSLDIFEENSFDLVVSNPPFHFEFENNIEISLKLFKEVFDVLKVGGRFQLVANQHLNYKVHLEKIFSETEVLGELDKFIVYECVK